MATVQELLDQECALANKGQGQHEFRTIILAEIRSRRGTEAPDCFGEDDCSTAILSRCPWRMDCGGSYD